MKLKEELSEETINEIKEIFIDELMNTYNLSDRAAERIYKKYKDKLNTAVGEMNGRSELTYKDLEDGTVDYIHNIVMG